MERPKSPYQEVTTEENAEIHGQLRDKTWRGLQTLRGRHHLLKVAAYLSKDPNGELARIADALEEFNAGIIRTSGSIEGKHRESTVQAIQGQKAPPLPLVGIQGMQQPNGHAKAVPV